MQWRALALAALWLIAAARPAPAPAEPLVIIVSAAWEDMRAIELSDLRAVYLGRRSSLSGLRVRRIDLPPGSAARAGFCESVLGREEAELERYWIEQALSGGALPPRQVLGASDVVSAVRGRPGTIGYVEVSELARLPRDGIRPIAILVNGEARTTGDPEYPAHTRDQAAQRAGRGG
jgi:hypothetical protein